jgi:hypothetical protein
MVVEVPESNTEAGTPVPAPADLNPSVKMASIY